VLKSCEAMRVPAPLALLACWVALDVRSEAQAPPSFVDPQIAVPTFPKALATGDLDGDALSDIALASGAGNVSVILAKGSGSFGVAASIPAPYADELTLADMNGDGLLECSRLDSRSA
jgi:VCBS repeat protein